MNFQFNSNLIIHKSLLTNIQYINEKICYDDFVFFNANEILLLIENLTSKIEKQISERYIPLCLRNDFETFLSVLALWQLGKIPFLMNPSFSVKEITKLMNARESQTIICDDILQQEMNGTNSFPVLEFSPGAGKKFIREDDKISLTTSGSSAFPKIVSFSCENFFASYHISKDVLNYNSNDRWLLSLPIFHIGGFSILMRAIFSGAEVVIPQSKNSLHIAKALKTKPTNASLVPTQLKYLVDENIEPNKELTRVLIGGGPADDDLIITAIDKGWKLFKVYGSTETTAFVTIMDCKECLQYPASSGLALNGVKIKIEKFDENSHIGEILISSPTLLREYDSPTEPIKTEDGFFFTGDIGYIDDNGFLFVMMRRTDLIISGGENVNPFEVEKEILQIEGIEDCCVFGMKDAKWGEVVSALIVSRNSSTFSEEKMNATLKKNLASFKIPKKYFIVASIPRTATGKIKREEIKNIYNKKIY